MKILLVSLHFPPANTMGALRIGGLASYLFSHAQDVRVLTAHSTGVAQNLSLEFPADRVIYTAWHDVNWLPKRVAATFRCSQGAGMQASAGKIRPLDSNSTEGATEKSHGWSWREVLYRSVLNWPDQWIGWMPSAVSDARKWLAGWSPDVIYASGPPHTSLLVGSALARRHRAPWIAELRDRWVDDPYRRYPRWRNRLEGRLLEGPVLRSAVGIITVSEPWAQFYSKKYGVPVFVIGNGYDPADYDCRLASSATGTAHLKIVYTGAIYAGRRDPSPLFEALGKMGKDRDSIRVEFFGTDRSRVMPHAVRYDVSDLVVVHPAVPHKHSAALQRQADILLLIQWNDPREQGNVPGKMFEYLGARRPILGLGLEDGVPATIIRERAAGFFSNDPASIAEQLRKWLEIKRRTGSIPLLPEAARAGFSRNEQFEKLAYVLRTCIPS